MFLAPSCSDLGESLLITTLLGIPLGEPDGKTPTATAPPMVSVETRVHSPGPVADLDAMPRDDLINQERPPSPPPV